MARLIACIAKEARIVSRDRDSLVVLFVMPLAFVLIMSLALQNVFKEQGGGAVFTGAVLDLDRGQVGSAVVQGVSGLRNMEARDVDGTEADIRKAVADGRYSFAIVIPAGSSG